MRTIYLAGPMEAVSKEEASGWRNDAKQILEFSNCIVLDPTRRIHQNDKRYMKQIFELDLRDIRESDIILANLEDPSIPKHGTAMEIFYAAYTLHIPVIAFKSDASSVHPFFECLVTEWRSDVFKACDTIISTYL